MRSLTGAIATLISGIAALLVAAGPALAQAPRCAAPSAPFRIAQRQSLGAVQVRALEAPGTTLPRLVLLDHVCHPVFSLVFGRNDPEAQGSEPPPHLLRFRAVTVAGMPNPVLLAVMASPGASDTEFETQLVAAQDGRFQALLPRAAISLLEGGVYLGDLGTGIGPGFAVWDMVWAAGEVHADPHRYALRRWRWTGQGFDKLPTLTTPSRHGDPAAALRELGVTYHDMTQDFADFAKYR